MRRALVTPHVGIGQTSAKIILFGEHSVVYGHPAIAVPLRSLRMRARVEPAMENDAQSTLTALGWSGALSDAPSHFASIQRAAAVATEFVGAPDARLALTTESGFPAQRGLGSSAAAAGAVIRAIFDAYDAPATPEQIFALTQEAEKVAHGRPSGLDAVATSATAPVHFQAGRTTQLDLTVDAWLVIADSGIQGSTRETVAHVRRQYDDAFEATSQCLARLGEITTDALDDLREARVEQLGAKMTESHALLSALGVSNDSLDALVSAARGAGALGGKLTGGGGGGCVIALAGTREDARLVEAAMLAAGAHATWSHAPSSEEVAA